MKKCFRTLAFVLALSCLSQAQAQNQAAYWEKSAEPATAARMIIPSKYLTFRLDLQEMKSRLHNAALKSDQSAAAVHISLPHPDGTFHEYRVYLNTVMHPQLAAAFPEIRAYDAVATDGSGNTAKLDITPQGFHAMILSPKQSSIFIDPYAFGETSPEHYIVYSRKDFQTSKQFRCDTGSQDVGQFDDLTPKAFGTCELRTYRLALAATAEYTTFHGGTVAQAQAAQVTTMNRVNGIYERDMAITMVIIPNNNLLIYTNALSDPYSNGNPSSMITQNQSNTNSVIGSSNYDIGHVFGTNSGGLAGLGVVCGNQKARGVTGSAAPVGDPFDIDYVAHEMGHQFAGNHSFNNSCSGNRNNNTAVEPGSGSTIMAYAGICTPNVQNNSDDHFHGRNLQEIGAFITGAGHTCPVKTPLSNDAPVVTGTAGNVTIPANTPFALTAIATDADGNTLTYCWEQMNNQISTQPPVATATGGPNFRSNSPSVSPTRYFPSIASQLSGGANTWEVIPSVNRTMNFRVTVRDNASGGGCNDHQDLTVTTTTSAGPFLVNYPSDANISWAAGSTKTVTWSVANTNNAPVACANVDIMLSTDGGATFTTILAGTPNDGSQDIVVPNSLTTQAIIMVICENGTFFDISNNVFAITASTNCDGPALPTIGGATTICAGGTATLTIDSGNLNDAGYWQWYSGTCGGTPVGTGASVTVSAAGLYFVRGEGGCIAVPGTCRSVNIQQTNVLTTVGVNGIQLTSNQASATYQWINCSGNTPVAGATSQSFTPSANGQYAVIVTRQGCTDTSACITVSSVGLDDLDALGVEFFPNPVSDVLTVEFSQSMELDDIYVTDALGRVITSLGRVSAQQVKIDLGKESRGMYFLNLRSGESGKVFRIVKQ